MKSEFYNTTENTFPCLMEDNDVIVLMREAELGTIVAVKHKCKWNIGEYFIDWDMKSLNYCSTGLQVLLRND